MVRFFLVLLTLLACFSVYGKEVIHSLPIELENLPIFYEGKIRSFDNCAKSWMQKGYHRQNLFIFSYFSKFPESCSVVTLRKFCFNTLNDKIRKQDASILNLVRNGASVNKISLLIASFFKPYSLLRKSSLYSFPSLIKLKIEKSFIKYPVLKTTFFLYALSLIAFVCSNRLSRRGFWRNSHDVLEEKFNFCMMTAWATLILGFLLHGLCLIFKAEVFAYPPHSTFFDSVLFLAWISLFIGLLFFVILRNFKTIVFSLIFSILLFLLLISLKVCDPFSTLAPLAGYRVTLLIDAFLRLCAFFFLSFAGILAHLSLIRSNKSSNMSSQAIAKSTYLQRNEAYNFPLSKQAIDYVYLGCFSLVLGTLLQNLWEDINIKFTGDWDKREFWAVTLICYYLMLLHFNHFKWIGTFISMIAVSLGMLFLCTAEYQVAFFLHLDWHHLFKGSWVRNGYLSILFLDIIFIVAIISKKMFLRATHK